MPDIVDMSDKIQMRGIATNLLLRSEVVHDVKELANFFGSLALYHVGYCLAANITNHGGMIRMVQKSMKPWFILTEEL